MDELKTRVTLKHGSPSQLRCGPRPALLFISLQPLRCGKAQKPEGPMWSLQPGSFAYAQTYMGVGVQLLPPECFPFPNTMFVHTHLPCLRAMLGMARSARVPDTLTGHSTWQSVAPLRPRGAEGRAGSPGRAKRFILGAPWSGPGGDPHTGPRGGDPRAVPAAPDRRAAATLKATWNEALDSFWVGWEREEGRGFRSGGSQDTNTRQH